MKCELLQNQLSDIIDGLLTPEEQRLVDNHLAECQKCAALVADVRQSSLVLQSLGDVSVPAVLKQRVMWELAKPTVRKNPWSFFLPRLAPVAAAVVVSVMSINMLPSYLTAQQNKSFMAPRVAAPEAGTEADGSRQTDDTVLNATQEFTTMAAGESFADDATPSMWVVTSAAGSTVFLLWGAVVYRWYKKS